MDAVFCYATLHYVLMTFFDFAFLKFNHFFSRYCSYTPQLFAREKGV